MRLLRLMHQDRPRVGVPLQDGTVVLAAEGTSVGHLLAGDEARARLEERLDGVLADPERSRDQGILVDSARRRLAPIDPTAVMVNVGANYDHHALPTRSASSTPELTWFIKGPASWSADRVPIELPATHPDRVDYEGELCVVFGRRCHGVTPDRAWAHIGGYTLMNDVSARDAWPDLESAATPSEERAAWNRMLLGKQLPTFGPIGPVVVTSDEITDLTGLRLTTRLNGSVVQDATVERMRIGIAELVSRLSEYFSFRPGDVLSTGTPSGVGQQRGRFLRPGDEVAVHAEGIGTLTNEVVAA